jgi:hypothetical protein
MHNIHIHVNLPSQCVNEVYNFRLRHKPPSQTKQKDKRLEMRLDRFLVNCQFFPESPTVIITIPCSDAPFPLSPVPIDDTNNNRLTSLFKDFASQIRGVMCVELRDTTGAIIPPIDSSRWRFIQADLGWDTPITPKQYRVMTDVQLTTFNDIVLQSTKSAYRATIMPEWKSETTNSQINKQLLHLIMTLAQKLPKHSSQRRQQ